MCPGSKSTIFCITGIVMWIRSDPDPQLWILDCTRYLLYLLESDKLRVVISAILE